MTDDTVGQSCTVTTGTTSTGTYEWYEVTAGRYIIVCEISAPV
jgi:hypothetical protein